MKVAFALLVGILISCSSVWAQAPDSTVLAEAERSLAAKKCKRTEQILAPLLERHPPAAEAIAIRARCAIYYEGRTEDGLTILSEGLHAHPESSMLFRTRGDVYNDLRMFERAEEDLRSAVEFADTDTERKRALTKRSWNMLSMRKHEEAMAFARQAYDLDSNDHAANNNMALAARELGDTATALHHQRRNLRIEPKNAVGWMNYGFLLASLGRHTEALAQYAEARNLGYDTAALHNNIGLSLLRTGDLAGARVAIERSLKKDGSNAYAHRNMALLALELGDMDMACDALEKALSWGFTKTYGNEVIELRKEHCK